MRLLIVEDEDELRLALARRLRRQGHGVDEAEDLATADLQLQINPYDAVVLDRRLPDGDSVDRLASWKQRQRLPPVILLTAMDQVPDRIEGLEAGADDYLVKPFAFDELSARIHAIARRAEQPGPTVVEVGDLRLDLGRREVHRGGTRIPLRPKEYTLLELLANQRGRVVERGRILDCCWDQAHEPASNVEEVLVASLRRKLGKPTLIHTVRGIGYRLEAPGTDP